MRYQPSRGLSGGVGFQSHPSRNHGLSTNRHLTMAAQLPYELVEHKSRTATAGHVSSGRHHPYPHHPQAGSTPFLLTTSLVSHTWRTIPQTQLLRSVSSLRKADSTPLALTELKPIVSADVGRPRTDLETGCRCRPTALFQSTELHQHPKQSRL